VPLAETDKASDSDWTPTFELNATTMLNALPAEMDALKRLQAETAAELDALLSVEGLRASPEIAVYPPGRRRSRADAGTEKQLDRIEHVPGSHAPSAAGENYQEMAEACKRLIKTASSAGTISTCRKSWKLEEIEDALSRQVFLCFAFGLEAHARSALGFFA
jgi:hypothetical protein